MAGRSYSIVIGFSLDVDAAELGIPQPGPLAEFVAVHDQAVQHFGPLFLLPSSIIPRYCQISWRIVAAPGKSPS